MDKKEQILEKVRKLLALAEDPAAHEGEIENALKAAQNLMSKYDLDMDEVLVSPSDISYEEQEYNYKRGERVLWTWDLLEIIARSQNCKTIKRFKIGKDKELETYFEVFGTKLEVKISKQIYAITVPIVRNLAKKRHREKSNKVIDEQIVLGLPINPPNAGKFFNDYVDGFMSGLQDKLNTNKQSNILEDKTGKYGLIVIRKDELVKSYIDFKYPKVKTAKEKAGREIDFETWLLGQQDGKANHNNLLD
jgi:hypothetical protein